MNIKSEKGTTITEIIAAVAILAMLMIPLSYIFTTSYTKFITESDRAAAQQVAREILYGDGLNFNGIIGDLEKSGLQSDEVNIENLSGNGLRISIPAATGSRIYEYLPDSNGGEFKYNSKKINEKSSAGYKIKINDFTVQKVSENDNNDSQIRVQVKVSCHNSGIVEVESSYRFPDIEK